jgi:hypothetical protein
MCFWEKDPVSQHKGSFSPLNIIYQKKQCYPKKLSWHPNEIVNLPNLLYFHALQART